MYLFSHLATTLNLVMTPINSREVVQCDHYQIQMVIKGSVSIESDGTRFIMKQDDIILLHPDITYIHEPITENLLLQISLTRNFMHSMIKNGYDIACNSAVGKKNDFIPLQSILTDMVIHYNKEDNHLKMCTSLYNLMECLNEKFLVAKKNPSNEQYYSERIAKITNFIETNYPMPLNLQTLADHMFLTPQYLSKFIKQNFGLNFNNYLNNVRMEHALIELRETNHSIISVAFNNGFASTTSFNKLFKEKFNLPPSSYRNQIIKEQLSVPSSSSIDPVDKEFNARSPLQKHFISTSIKRVIHPPWLKVINLGFAQNILSHNFREIFIECQSRMSFTYARIENILSDKIISYIPKTNTYNFTVCDDIINFLMMCKAYPLIELAPKPDKIFFTPEVDVPYDQILKTAYEHVQSFDSLLKHSINRYGREYVSKWQFELWNPMDENLNPLITPAEYVKLYLTYLSVLQRYLPNLSIGGPGFNASGDYENFIQVLKCFKQEKALPAFTSIYLFSYESDSYSASLDSTPLRFLSLDASRFKKIVSRIKETIYSIFFEDLPIYVTVFNSSILPEMFIANSSFQASFLCKNALDLLEDVSALGYWIFTDISNEYATSQPNLISGIGLIDTYGIKKPSYFALEFLSRLGNQLIEQGTNYCVTASSDNKYQVIAYNYAHYNKYFCINCKDRVEFHNTYSVFEETAPLPMQITLTQLPPGRYKIRKHILNRKNGSFLDEFIHILELGNSTPEELLYLMLNMQISEVDYYKSICIPRQEISYANCEDHLVLTFNMEPHEVNYFSISRKL